jgi:hypothetical protein
VTSVTTSPGTGTLGVGKIVTLTVAFTETVTVTGGTPTLLLNDGGTAKYTGGSGKNALTFTYTVAKGDTTPDLTVTGTALNGATIQHGAGNPADLTAAVANPAGVLQIDGIVPVKPIPGSTFLLTDTTTKVTNTAAIGTAYTGTVAGVLHSYTTTGSDGFNVTTTSPGWFIQTGSGGDAINLAKGGGNNILDAGTGSNFLLGGTGHDTYFLDARGATAPTWSDIAGFHAGDTATIWGISPADFTIGHVDNLGATGYKGLTYEFTATGMPVVALTLSKFSNTDLLKGHLIVTYGTTADASGAASPYMQIVGH